MQEQQGSGLAVSKETPCSLNTLKINGISLDLSPQVLAALQSRANVSSTSPSTFPPEVFSQLQMQLQSLAFSENASANPTSFVPSPGSCKDSTFEAGPSHSPDAIQTCAVVDSSTLHSSNASPSPFSCDSNITIPNPSPNQPLPETPGVSSQTPPSPCSRESRLGLSDGSQISGVLPSPHSSIISDTVPLPSLSESLDKAREMGVELSTHVDVDSRTPGSLSPLSSPLLGHFRPAPSSSQAISSPQAGPFTPLPSSPPRSTITPSRLLDPCTPSPSAPLDPSACPSGSPFELEDKLTRTDLCQSLNLIDLYIDPELEVRREDIDLEEDGDPAFHLGTFDLGDNPDLGADLDGDTNADPDANADADLGAVADADLNVHLEKDADIFTFRRSQTVDLKRKRNDDHPSHSEKLSHKKKKQTTGREKKEGMKQAGEKRRAKGKKGEQAKDRNREEEDELMDVDEPAGEVLPPEIPRFEVEDDDGTPAVRAYNHNAELTDPKANAQAIPSDQIHVYSADHRMYFSYIGRHSVRSIPVPWSSWILTLMKLSELCSIQGPHVPSFPRALLAVNLWLACRAAY